MKSRARLQFAGQEESSRIWNRAAAVISKAVWWPRCDMQKNNRNNRDSHLLKCTMLAGLSGFVCVADATGYNSGINSFSLCG